jgi:glycosyltransferase involved in cell wall biosynthesis
MKVVFIGNLAGGAYMMARPVAQAGIEACLMLAAWEGPLARPEWEGRGTPDPGLSIAHYGAVAAPEAGRFGRLVARLKSECSALRFLPIMLKADIIQSFTGSLFACWVWLFAFGVLRLKPYIACASGSDLREAAATGGGYSGWLFRRFFGRAARVLLLNLDMPAIADRLQLGDARFFPFAVDTGYFRPRAVPRCYGAADALLIFMPSHLDWGEVDAAPGRSSTKGNDRLIRAFARFLAAGRKGHLVLLDRGPDRFAARRLVESLAIADQVSFRPQMAKTELSDHLAMADVVADQFDIGAYGTITLEAMACAKPVLVHVDPQAAARCYDTPPPILAARTEDEILARLEEAADPQHRRALGEAARDWVVAQHDAAKVAARLIALYREVVERP